jgi:O-antigen ligase
VGPFNAGRFRRLVERAARSAAAFCEENLDFNSPPHPLDGQPMNILFNSIRRFRPSLSFLLLLVLTALLWISGGASRADVLGQVVVRAAAWGGLLVAILLGERPKIGSERPVLLILLATILLVLAQLIPLPPTVWQALPGRGVLAEASVASNQPQPWRPLAIVPSATVNAASSLIVPFVVLFLLAGLKERERDLLPAVLLVAIGASMLMGLLQFSGVVFHNPLINDTPGQVYGTFANRNHFALWLALGIVLAPAWAFLNGQRSPWRSSVALALVLLFSLTILATGSRAGMLLAVVAIGLTLPLTWRGLRKVMRRRAPRWAIPALIVSIVGVIAVLALIAVEADRAVSIDRAFELDAMQDMRVRGWPVVVAMIKEYFPWGSGFGAFDPVFRISEPLYLLKPGYFNHAHNDFLEIVLEGGLPGLLLLTCGILYWLMASAQAWFTRGNDTAKLGSALIFLILLGSIPDYPGRTPLIMTALLVAGVWLSGCGSQASRPRFTHG